MGGSDELDRPQQRPLSIKPIRQRCVAAQSFLLHAPASSALGHPEPCTRVLHLPSPPPIPIPKALATTSRRPITIPPMGCRTARSGSGCVPAPGIWIWAIGSLRVYTQLERSARLSLVTQHTYCTDSRVCIHLDGIVEFIDRVWVVFVKTASVPSLPLMMTSSSTVKATITISSTSSSAPKVAVIFRVSTWHRTMVTKKMRISL